MLLHVLEKNKTDSQRIQVHAVHVRNSLKTVDPCSSSLLNAPWQRNRTEQRQIREVGVTCVCNYIHDLLVGLNRLQILLLNLIRLSFI